jgi:hypothetical protein
MFLFYLISLLPLFFGGYLYFKFRNIHWQEWLLSVLICLFLTVGIHTFNYSQLPDDLKTVNNFIEILGVSPKKWQYPIFTIVVLGTQTWFWFWAINNDLNKFSAKRKGTTVYINPLSLNKANYKSRK